MSGYQVIYYMIPSTKSYSRRETICIHARGSYKALVTGRQIPKPSGIGSRELLTRRLRLADQNTSQ